MPGRKEIRAAVSIHTPAWGVTRRAQRLRGPLQVSIHTPAWGVTPLSVIFYRASMFQSTLPRGE